VRIIEPFGVGGGPDLIARAIIPRLSELWGQPVILENHPGKGSTEAPALVAKSPADGSTLLVNTSAQAYSAALVKNLPYDPLKDFIPVAPLTSQAYLLVAGKVSGITTVGGQHLEASGLLVFRGFPQGVWAAVYPLALVGVKLPLDSVCGLPDAA